MRYSPITLAVLRIVTGFLMLPHGGQKLFGWFGGIDGSGATVAFPSLLWFAGVIELVGGLLLLLGVFTRIAAFLLSGEMAVAYFTAHASHGLLPLVNHGELAVLYCFVFLLFAVVGSGSYALESLWHHGMRMPPFTEPRPHLGQGAR